MRILLLFTLSALLSHLVAAQVISHRSLGTNLDNLIRWNSVYAEAHSGFSLADLDSGEQLYGYNAERYFVPASNIKLLTYYLAQRELSEGAPAVYYTEHGDTTEIWGTGYPLLLHPSFFGYDTLRGWLADRRGALIFHVPDSEEPPRYGNGWSWDDYNYGYVYERSSLPVYGNRLFLDYHRPEEADGGPAGLFGSPPGVAGALIQNAAQPRAITRREGSNQFIIGGNFYHPGNFPLERPLSVTPDFVVGQLAEAFPGVQVSLGESPRPPAAQLRELRVDLPDTLYRKMLQDSDNFLAEQLVLLSAARRYGWGDEDTFFDYVTDTLFTELSLGSARYADGSGLSRYSLLKPWQLTQLLIQLDRSVGRSRLSDLLSAGGVSGTLERRFNNRPETYVWAKTGTLSGVICVSGLLRSRSGRWLTFSFMHNNVMGRTSDYYREMETTLGWVYDNL